MINFRSYKNTTVHHLIQSYLGLAPKNDHHIFSASLTATQFNATQTAIQFATFLRIISKVIGTRIYNNGKEAHFYLLFTYLC